MFVSTATSSGEARDTCVGWAARRTFTHALCSCGDVGVASTLVSRATDSSPHPVDGPAGSAAVGINGSYRQAESLRTDGSLTIAGEAGLSPNVGIDVAGDLRLAGPAAAAGPIFVGRDAWVLAATSSLSLIEVERDLYVGPGATVTSFGPVLVGGERFERPFAVAPPWNLRCLA